MLKKDPEHMLTKFGLSPNQSKVYLCLCKTGIKTASQISKSLNIPRTETYFLLKNLQKKELIALKNGRPWKFKANPIEVFLENKIRHERQKVQRLEETLSMVKKLKQKNDFIVKSQIAV